MGITILFTLLPLKRLITFERRNVSLIRELPFSWVLNRCDTWFFPQLKGNKKVKLTDNDEVFEFVLHFLRYIPMETFCHKTLLYYYFHQSWYTNDIDNVSA